MGKRAQRVLYFETNRQDPYYNLAFEELLFQRKQEGEVYLMLWQNENAVIIGRHQNILEEVDLEYAERQKIRIVRRNSGGGAVYHDRGNLNFTIIVDERGSAMDNGRFILPVVQTLKGLGVTAEFTGRNDILVGQRKISGNAQYVADRKVLHHGTLLFDCDLCRMNRVLTGKYQSSESRSLKSVWSRVVNLREFLQREIGLEEFWGLLKGQMAGQYGMEYGVLEPEEYEEVQRLCEEKYRTWEWNYGRTPPYDRRNRETFSSGTVEVSITAQRGRIQEIRLIGDFFCRKELEDLERGLVGAPLGYALRERLHELQAGEYIVGVGEEALFHLITG